MSDLWQKLVTRPLWWWERKRPYPVRNAIWRATPRTCAPAAEVRLVISATRRTLADAGWAAASLLRQLPGPVGLTIVADAFPEPEATRLRALFPDAELRTDDDIAAAAAGTLPNVARLGAYHPMGRKLMGILHLQRTHHLVFADADVLAFRDLPEVRTALATPGARGLFIQDDSCKFEAGIEARGRELGLACHPRFSCGFMVVPRGSLDLGIAEALLAGDERITSWFPDTMVLAFLMDRAGATALPDDDYVQTTQRQFVFESDVDYEKIRVRHFVGPVRQLMYLRGMPALRRTLLAGG